MESRLPRHIQRIMILVLWQHSVRAGKHIKICYDDFPKSAENDYMKTIIKGMKYLGHRIFDPGRGCRVSENNSQQAIGLSSADKICGQS